MLLWSYMNNNCTYSCQWVQQLNFRFNKLKSEMKLNDLPTLMVWNKRFISWKWICKCKFTNLLIILNFSLVCFHYLTNIIKNSLSLSIKVIKIETLLNIFFLFFLSKTPNTLLKHADLCTKNKFTIDIVSAES